MPRESRKLSSTGIYHIMLRGNERKDLFKDRADRRKFLESLGIKQDELKFSVYAYCLMKNHVHLLLNTEDADLASIMKGIAVRYASFFNWKYDRVGHVFQDRFKSEPVEDDRYLLAAVRYIHNNPVQAGLTANPDEYEWSSYHQYLGSVGKPWLNTSFVLSLFSEDKNAAMYEFQTFSMESQQITFLDCEDKKEIRTLQEGKTYLEEYIKRETPTIEISLIKEDKLLRNQVIRHLRTETSLSQRIIAQLLGVSKAVVERIKEL